MSEPKRAATALAITRLQQAAASATALLRMLRLQLWQGKERSLSSLAIVR